MDLPGKYGTIALLRAGTGELVTSFGIDTTALTFGREPTCGVRLYYPDVAPVHARIVFTPLDSSPNSKAKAFLEVLGPSGVVVDGCRVYPNTDTSATPKTIALGNNSEVEIHNKRFRFSYPPKDADIRAAMAASPKRPPNRALRLSMIASAQVFSPRPSHDPRQNLRVLQSPLRLPPAFSPSKTKARSPSKSPTKSGFSATTVSMDDSSSDEEDEHEEITLVQGSHPRVVEEARDLVILEDVELALPIPASPSAAPAPAPKTPARRQSLHRAVLIRSAQRAVLGAQRAPAPVQAPAASFNRPATTSPIRGWTAPTLAASAEPQEEYDSSDEDEDDEDEEEVRGLRLEVVSVSSGSETEEDEEEGEHDQEVPVRDENAQAQRPRLGWRKSLEKLTGWAWGGGKVKEEEEDVVLSADAAADEEEEEEEAQDDVQEHTPTRSVPSATPTASSTNTPTPIPTARKPNNTPSWVSPAKSSTQPPSSPASGSVVKPRKTVPRPVSPEKMAATSTRSPSPSIRKLDLTQLQPKDKASARKTPPMTPFGRPHPDAVRPVGFGAGVGRKTDVGLEKEKEGEGVTKEVKEQGSREDEMDVDAEGYQPIYEDLSALRAEQSRPAEGPKEDKEKGARESEDTAPLKPKSATSRPLAAFMTPQPVRRTNVVDVGRGAATPAPAPAASRYSLGGAARRVPVQDSPWKVKDLVAVPDTPEKEKVAPRMQTPRISDEEKRAISERRKSALTAPDLYFAGGVPGMSPVKRGRGVALGKVKEEGDKETGKDEDKNGTGEDPRKMLAELREVTAELTKRRESVMGVANAGRLSSSSDEEMPEEVAIEPVVAVTPKGRSRSRSKSPVKKSQPAEPEPQQEMEVEVDEQPAPAPRSKSRSKSPVKRQQPAEPEPQAEMEVELEEQPAPAPAKPARRTCKATPPVEEPMAVAEPSRTPAPTKATRRTRKATAESQSEEMEHDEVPALPVITHAAPAKVRRGRSKTSAQPESDNEAAAAAPAPRRTARKPPSITADTVPAPVTEPVAKRGGRATRATTPASAPERKTRGRSRAPVEEESEVDPLDTIDAEVEIVEVVPAPAKKRAARSVKGKVKEEETEVVLEAEGTAVPAPPPTRAGRGKKTATTAATPALPAAPKSRATRKTVPGSAPAAVETVDKENAPGDEEVEPATKITRVSRSRKVKEEVVEPEVTQGVPRRATRTRTRT